MLIKTSSLVLNISTRYRRGLSLVYYEENPSIAEAIEKEKYIKDLGVARFLAKI